MFSLVSFGLVSLVFEELGHDIAYMEQCWQVAGWKDQMESAWSTSWKQSMFHAFTPGRHLWILAGCLDVKRVDSNFGLRFYTLFALR